MPTQIRLLLMEQSDQGLLCFFILSASFEHNTGTVKSNCSNCRTTMVIISGVPIFRIFTVSNGSWYKMGHPKAVRQMPTTVKLYGPHCTPLAQSEIYLLWFLGSSGSSHV